MFEEKTDAITSLSIIRRTVYLSRAARSIIDYRMNFAHYTQLARAHAQPPPDAETNGTRPTLMAVSGVPVWKKASFKWSRRSAMRGGYSLLREHAESALKLQRRTSESCVSWDRYPSQRVALSRVRSRHRMLVDSAGTVTRVPLASPRTTGLVS